MTTRKTPEASNAVTAVETVIENVVDDELDRRRSRTEDKFAHDLSVELRTRIAALRRRRVPSPPKPSREISIPTELLALGRDELVAQLQLRRQQNVRVAHLDLVALSDNDLRIVLAECIALEKTSKE